MTAALVAFGFFVALTAPFAILAAVDALICNLERVAGSER